MNQFFDLHFHPLSKNFLIEYDDEKRKAMKYTEPIGLPGLGTIANSLAGNILNSQACVEQAAKSGIRLGVANIVSVEYVFATRKGLLALFELDLFGRQVIAPLDKRYFEFVRAERAYHSLFDKELDFYQWVAKEGKGTKINILSRKNAQGTKLKNDQLNLVLAIEGGHNFCPNGFHNGSAKAYSVLDIIAHYRGKGKPDFLYLTLTHLSHIPQQVLCSHAFGFKLVNGVPQAYPQVNGLRPLGKEVIKACLDTSGNEFPLLIDVKHMSLKGRKDFYAERKRLLEDASFSPPKDAKGNVYWPILATHMGVNGYRSSDMPLLMKEVGIESGVEQSVRVMLGRRRAGELTDGLGIDSVYFNPASINLCDDDIEEIALSNGLIGISLDARILGFEGFKKRWNTKDEFDYFSLDDFAALFPERAKKLPKLAPLLEDSPEQAETFAQESFEEIFAGRAKREAYLFCLNVLHTVAVIQQLPAEERQHKNGWEFVCIGSDYDGLIDSIKLANKATDLPDFKRELKRYFRKADKVYRNEFDYQGALFPDKEGEEDIGLFLDHLFYLNGSRFLKDWWGIDS